MELCICPYQWKFQPKCSSEKRSLYTEYFMKLIHLSIDTCHSTLQRLQKADIKSIRQLINKASITDLLGKHILVSSYKTSKKEYCYLKEMQQSVSGSNHEIWFLPTYISQVLKLRFCFYFICPFCFCSNTALLSLFFNDQPFSLLVYPSFQAA